MTPVIPLADDGASEDSPESQSVGFLEKISDVLSKTVVNLMSSSKNSMDALKEEQKQSMDDLISNFVDSQPTDQEDKWSFRILKTFFKNFVQSKFFENASKAFQGIWKTVKSMTGGILDLLMMLALLAIFDPSGSFITSIISFLANALIWIIGLIGKMLPGIIMTMIKLIPIIAKALYEALMNISSALSDMFFNFGKFFPEGSLLRQVMDLLGWFFGKDGTVQVLLRALMDFFGKIGEGKWKEAIMGLLNTVLKAAADLLMNLLPLAIDLIKTIVKGLAEMIMVDLFGMSTETFNEIFDLVWGYIQPSLDFIMGVVGAFQTFFNDIGEVGIWQALWNLVVNLFDNWVNYFVGMAQAIFNIIDYILGFFGTSLGGLGELFMEWVVNPIVGFFMFMWNIFVGFWTYILSLPSRFVAFMKKKAKELVDYLGDMWDRIIKGFWSVINFLRSMPSRILNGITNGITNTFSSIFSSMATWFQTNFLDPIADILNSIINGVIDLIPGPLASMMGLNNSGPAVSTQQIGSQLGLQNAAGFGQYLEGLRGATDRFTETDARQAIVTYGGNANNQALVDAVMNTMNEMRRMSSGGDLNSRSAQRTLNGILAAVQSSGISTNTQHQAATTVPQRTP